MKKKLLMTLLFIVMLVIPNFSLAENKDPINIYMFRGQGCGYCRQFLNYVNDTLIEKYNGKFNLVAYEVWYNDENASLMDKVADFMSDNPTGVPYIIIGDKTFEGYAESFNTEIETAIENLYNSNDRYDVFEKMEKDLDLDKNESKTFNEVLSDEGITFNAEAYSKENTSNDSNESVLLIWNFIIMVIGIISLVIMNFKNKKDILKELELLKKDISKNKYKK